MQVEDLHVAEGHIEESDDALADLLAEKERSNLRATSMREYLLLGRRGNTQPPERVMTRWEHWAYTATQHLRNAEDRADQAED